MDTSHSIVTVFHLDKKKNLDKSKIKKILNVFLIYLLIMVGKGNGNNKLPFLER